MMLVVGMARGAVGDALVMSAGMACSAKFNLRHEKHLKNACQLDLYRIS